MSITKTRATSEVVLWQGEDYERHDELQARLRSVTASYLSSEVPSKRVHAVARRMGDADPLVEVTREYDEWIDGALERAVKLRLMALPRRQFRDLLEQHPPREDVRAPDTIDDGGKVTKGEVVESWPEDHRYGFNVDTLADDLVPPSVAAGQFDSDEERDVFLDDLSDAEWSKVYSAAISLNQKAGPDPKARASSLLDLMSSATSESQPDSD